MKLKLALTAALLASPAAPGEDHAAAIHRRIADPNGGPIVVAHRGCHAAAPDHSLPSVPENSTAALDHCVAIGVDGGGTKTTTVAVDARGLGGRIGGGVRADGRDGALADEDVGARAAEQGGAGDQQIARLGGGATHAASPVVVGASVGPDASRW